MKRILTLAFKDLLLLTRDKPSLFFTCCFPVIFAVFFGMIFSDRGESPGIPIVVVDEDATDGSRALLDQLSNAPELDVTTQTATQPLRTLTRDEAADLVRRGRRTAFLIIPKGYADPEGSLFTPGGGAELEIGIDPSRIAEAGMLEGIITRYAFERFTSVIRDPAATRREIERARRVLGASSAVPAERRTLMFGMFAGIDLLMADMQKGSQPQPQTDDSSPSGQDAVPDSADTGFAPVRLKKTQVAVARRGPANSFALTFGQAVLWGVAGCAASFGLSLVIERARGTLQRLRTTPLSFGSVVAGKALACFIAILAVSSALLGFAYLVFDVRPVAPLILMMALVSIAVCFTGIMMVLAVIGRSESSAGATGWAVMLVLMMLGGGTIPIFFMPRWMQNLADFSPVRWGILAVEGGLWRDFSVHEMLLPCGILLAIGAACTALGVKLFRWVEQS